MTNKKSATGRLFKIALSIAGGGTITGIGFFSGFGGLLVPPDITGGSRQLAPCTGADSVFSRQPFDTWPTIYHATVAQVVDAHLKNIDNASQRPLVCIASNYASMVTPTPALRALASTLPPWQDTKKMAALSETEIGPVLLEYLRVYECAMNEQATFMTIRLLAKSSSSKSQSSSSSSSSSSAITNTATLGDEESRQRGIIDHELLISRTALDRTLQIVGGEDRLLPLSLEVECLKRTSLDLRNDMGLIAQESACLPRIDDARGSLRDLSDAPNTPLPPISSSSKGNSSSSSSNSSSSSSVFSSSEMTLYSRIKSQVDEENDKTRLEPEVEDYIQEVVKERDNLQITVKQIDAAIQGDEGGMCGDTTSPARNTADCPALMQEIQRIAKDEERARQLARDLQLTATSYELPIAGLPGRSLQLATDMRGLVNFWTTDNASTSSSDSASSVSSAPLIRTRQVNPNSARSAITQLGDALTNLSPEALTAAVWHYQYGYRLIQGNRFPAFPAPTIDGQSGDGTERQYLFKRQTEVEAALSSIWGLISNDTFSPPLAKDETVMYVFPQDLVKQYLPDNVIVWARKSDNDSFSDVGLQWGIPLEPVMPSLISLSDSTAILGGKYPPEPVIPGQSTNGLPTPQDGQGLCSDPIQNRGYLCKPFTVSNGESCPGSAQGSGGNGRDSSSDPSAITLVTCMKPSDQQTTIAGPEVCRDTVYQAPAPFDPNKQCHLTITCIDDSSETDYYGHTSGKAADGTISIHIKNSTPPAATYVLFHELHHAYQNCALPPAKDPANYYAGMTQQQANLACCRNEGEAHQANCDIMGNDGLFNGVAPLQGIPFNAETCAEVSTDQACIHDTGLGCFTSRTYPPEFFKKMIEVTTKNPSNVATTCSQEVIGKLKAKDPRNQALINLMVNQKSIEAPGTTSQYTNRIGNNLCYIGQMVEAAAELHRISPAQSPINVGDESFPWNNPAAGSPLGLRVIRPPLAASPLPSYRPQLIMQDMDQALCQLQGLPAKTPSILCSIETTQHITFATQSAVQSVEAMLSNMQNQQSATANLLQMGPGLGARLGTDLYEEYLQIAGRSFAQVVSTAVSLFGQMSAIGFPTQMCPTDQNLAPPLSSLAPSS